MDYFGKGVIDNLDFFVQGLWITIWVSLFSAIISLVIGLVIAILRVTPSGGLGWLATAYAEFFRNTPLLVQATALFFGLPKLGVRLQFQVGDVRFTQQFCVGVLALSLYTGAYVSEAIRSGLIAVPFGQTEASRSLGLSLIQTFRYVVIPQAFRVIIPPLGNLYIAMVKNSSILSAIGLADLMYQADYVNNRTFRTFEILLAIILFYLLLTLPLGWLVSRIERKLNPLRATSLKLKGAQ
jgi:aspartate/glutamate/glutamine transport system permease protein